MHNFFSRAMRAPTRKDEFVPIETADAANRVNHLKAELAQFQSPERFARLNADLVEAEAILEALAEAGSEE